MTETLKYKGKEYPVRCGYYALKHTSLEVKKQTGKELNMDNIMQEQDITIMEPLLFHSLVMGAKIEEKELDLQREDMEFMLDICLKEFIEIFTNSLPKEEKK